LFIPELKIKASSGADSPVFRCGIDLNVRILMNRASQDDILKSLSAKGNIKLTNAVLDNMNVLSAALDGLSMLPGLVQKLRTNLPEKYKPLLEKNSTEFKPIDAGFEMRDGRIFFDKLRVESDAFYLLNKGSVGMDNQDLQISAVLFIPQDLSAAFSSTVPELQYLEDTNGLITMPLEITGKVPNIAVMPDLNYVLQKLIASKGQELLNRLFKAR
jgi:hypothetical protein